MLTLQLLYSDTELIIYEATDWILQTRERSHRMKVEEIPVWNQTSSSTIVPEITKMHDKEAIYFDDLNFACS